MSIQVHQHNSRSGLELEVGKQSAALLRLAMLSGGSGTIIISPSPEMAGVISVLAGMESIDWSKILILPMGEFFGISKNSRGSLQQDLYKKLIQVKPKCSTAGLINGEGIPSTERSRLNQLLELHRPDVFLTCIGSSGEIGLIDHSIFAPEETGYQIIEPSNEFRKNQVDQNQFRTLNEVPRKSLSMTISSAFNAKHVICCMTGRTKSELASKLLNGQDVPETCKGLLQHPNVHIHLDSEAASLIKKS